MAPFVASGALPGYVAGVSVARERRIHAAGATATGPRQPEVFVAFWDAVYRGL